VPNYVYDCSSCDQKFEIFHSMTDPLPVCPSCEGADTLKRDYTTTFGTPQFNKLRRDKPVGQVVRDFIEDAKREVQVEKTRLPEEGFND